MDFFPLFFSQGLTSIGKPYLTDSQFQALCELFSDPKQKEHVLWKKFVSTLEDPGEGIWKRSIDKNSTCIKLVIPGWSSGISGTSNRK